jgi:hypothetical protein
MASLDVGTEAIVRQDIVDRYADYVEQTANSGISWGTNAIPHGYFSRSDIFGGTTDGQTRRVNDTSIGSPAPAKITASTIYDTLLADAQLYTNMRNIRVLLYLSGYGYTMDTTAKAHLTTDYRLPITISNPDILTDKEIVAGNLEVFFDSLRVAYNNAQSTLAATIEDSYCHSSCHSSCHGSRGRR